MSRWTDINEGYRSQFADCDARNVFRGHQLNRKIGKRFYYGCSADKSRVTVLRRLAPVAGAQRGLVAYTSKLSVDLDGSWYACNTPGKTDLCGTSLGLKGPRGVLQPTSSDQVTYIAVPASGPTPALSKEFSQLTGVRQGDFGVLVTAKKVIPIIVADGGPFSKLGEGSIALHRALGHELCQAKDGQGRCRTVKRPLSSLAGPFVTIIAPGSRRNDVTAANVVEITRREGERIWALARAHVKR